MLGYSIKSECQPGLKPKVLGGRRGLNSHRLAKFSEVLLNRTEEHCCAL